MKKYESHEQFGNRGSIIWESWALLVKLTFMKQESQDALFSSKPGLVFLKIVENSLRRGHMGSGRQQGYVQDQS